MSKPVPWSEEEIQITLDMRKHGSTPNEISELLSTQGYNRTPGAVAKKITNVTVFNPINPTQSHEEYCEYSYPTPERLKLSKGKKLLCICCAHIGEKNMNEQLFDEYLAWAKKEKCRIVLGGDLINNGMVFGTKHIGSIWDDKYTPQQQMDIAVEKLTPVKDQIDAIISGNHGGRTQKLTSIDPERWIAKALG
ncbi:MAG TPA: hypothetical protein VNX68_01345, partial [Nitrosopumilaceae archaeon]|nr:hypothetical protein [Nitrosopumilaceae archaeon]